MKKTKIILIAIIIIFATLSLVFYFKYVNLRSDYLYRVESTPHIELINYLSFSDTGIASGSASGFVAFYNKDEQPKNIHQYYEIEALNKFDNGSSQIFSLEEIIVFDYIPPHRFDKIILTTKANTKDTLTLEDADGNLFIINKNNDEIKLIDAGGDSTYLITDLIEYGKFIRSFLK